MGLAKVTPPPRRAGAGRRRPAANGPASCRSPGRGTSLRHHPRQVVGTLPGKSARAARRARSVPVGGPLDDRDHPLVPRRRDGLRAHRDPRGPVGVALPVDAPLGPRGVKDRPLARRHLSAHHVVGERCRPVVGRICATATHPGIRLVRAGARSGTQRIRSVNDRSAGGASRRRGSAATPAPAPDSPGQVPCEVGERRHPPMMTRSAGVDFPSPGMTWHYPQLYSPLLTALRHGQAGPPAMAYFGRSRPAALVRGQRPAPNIGASGGSIPRKKTVIMAGIPQQRGGIAS